MFRPFLPCGIACGFAYGSAYALPMALPMAFHALFPAEGIPPGCLYCTISARCLSTGFGRISAAFAFFRRRGVPPCRGGIAPALQARRALAAPYGAEPQRHLFTLPRGRGPSQTPKFLSPGPPSPWLPALPIERRFYRFCTELATPKTSPPAGACLARSVSAANGLMQGCRGRSPRRNKLKSLPLPRRGRGSGG